MHRMIRFFLLLMMAVLLAACSGAEAVPTSAPTPSPVPPTPVPTSTPTPEPSGPVLTVPEVTGPAPVMDGTMSPGEWEGAAVERFANGSELLLMQVDGYLYLGVRSVEPGVMTGNLFIQRGDVVSILHSSAALGTAIYQLEEEAWVRSQNFDWRCRDTGSSERAQKERNAFLESDGWVASNGLMGAENELEYMIVLDEPITALALNILHEFESNPFPAELADACVQTYPGGMPEEMDFAVLEWARLELED